MGTSGYPGPEGTVSSLMESLAHQKLDKSTNRKVQGPIKKSTKGRRVSVRKKSYVFGGLTHFTNDRCLSRRAQALASALCVKETLHGENGLRRTVKGKGRGGIWNSRTRVYMRQREEAVKIKT